MWRVLNVYRSVRFVAQTSTTPVQTFLTNQGTDTLSTALFPQDLRTLLTNNENTILNSGQEWLGRGGSTNTAGVQPFTNINIAHAGPSRLS